MCAKIDVIRDFKHISESSLGEQIVVHGDFRNKKIERKKEKPFSCGRRKGDRQSKKAKKTEKILWGSVSLCVCVCRENRSQNATFRKIKDMNE